MTIIIPGEPTPTENAPLKDGKPMFRFEVKMRQHGNGAIQKAIFIGGELLDWSVDVTQLADAMRMGPAIFREVQKDVERHFVDSVSEFIGRKVTAQDIKKATVEGWI